MNLKVDLWKMGRVPIKSIHMLYSMLKTIWLLNIYIHIHPYWIKLSVTTHKGIFISWYWVIVNLNVLSGSFEFMHLELCKHSGCGTVCNVNISQEKNNIHSHGWQYANMLQSNKKVNVTIKSFTTILLNVLFNHGLKRDTLYRGQLQG